MIEVSKYNIQLLGALCGKLLLLQIENAILPNFTYSSIHNLRPGYMTFRINVQRLYTPQSMKIWAQWCHSIILFCILCEFYPTKTLFVILWCKMWKLDVHHLPGRMWNQFRRPNTSIHWKPNSQIFHLCTVFSTFFPKTKYEKGSRKVMAPLFALIGIRISHVESYHVICLIDPS